jgi:hypothetical protein
MDWLANRPICIEDIIKANIFKSNKTIPGNMGADHDERSLRRYNNLIPVGWTILVMGISLATVVILWVWFGHIGPTYASDTLIHQQKTLRQHYGLPPQPAITDPKALITPPSLRDVKNNTVNSNKQT